MLLLAGCRTAAPSTPGQHAPAHTATNSGPTGAYDTAFGDPCADRMQAVGGALFEYYVDTKRLPDRLEELRKYADIGPNFQFTCPVSGLPYVYVPGGMASPTSKDRLVLYDAAPSHNGMRYVLFLKREQNNLITWPYQMREADFLTFATLPSAPTTQK